MKIGICGPGRAGKDTAAEFLRDEYGLRYTHGTSRWAATLVWVAMTKLGHEYDTVEECFNDRHNYRQLWAKIIGKHNAADPVRMYRECLQAQDLLTGIRWRNEFAACKAAGLCDVWLWIDRPNCIDPTCEITPADCDGVIRNHGTLDEFRDELRRWANDFLRSTAHAVSLAQRS
mgnify:CR=1 FL=1|jgi:hypothetical protein|tara:strand:- start:584 stop:1105 length:522 start_codon:yes stop_codon:yes gene_type:complete